MLSIHIQAMSSSFLIAYTRCPVSDAPHNAPRLIRQRTKGISLEQLLFNCYQWGKAMVNINGSYL